MVDTRETPTPSNTTGGLIGEGEYGDAVAAQTRALWSVSALVIQGLTGTNDLEGFVEPAIDGPYSAGMSFWLVPTADNTDEMTLDLSQGAEPLVDAAGDPLTEGAVLSDVAYLVLFDGAQFRIISSQATGGSETATGADVQTFLASGTWTKP